MSAAIWFRPTRSSRSRFYHVNLPRHLGIEFTEIGADFLRGRMPVDERTRQPFGILHGGAGSARETLGSGGGSVVDPTSTGSSVRRSTPITCAR